MSRRSRGTGSASSPLSRGIELTSQATSRVLPLDNPPSTRQSRTRKEGEALRDSRQMYFNTLTPCMVRYISLAME